MVVMVEGGQLIGSWNVLGSFRHKYPWGLYLAEQMQKVLSKLAKSLIYQLSVDHCPKHKLDHSTPVKANARIFSVSNGTVQGLCDIICPHSRPLPPCHQKNILFRQTLTWLVKVVCFITLIKLLLPSSVPADHCSSHWTEIAL